MTRKTTQQCVVFLLIETMERTDILPKEITKDCDTNHEVAWFGYYDGLTVAGHNNLKQTTSFQEVWTKTHFIVTCGEIGLRVEPTDYPTIERRII